MCVCVCLYEFVCVRRMCVCDCVYECVCVSVYVCMRILPDECVA